MTPLDCSRELDVIDAVVSQRWPQRADEALREHVARCPICSDVAEVASSLRDEHDAVMAEAAHLPSAELIWFRAQARARAEAARQAARPIAIMQALGLAVATSVVSVLIGLVAFWVWQRADWLASMPSVNRIGLDTMSFAIRGVLLAIGLWLLLAPVAVYLVASDD